jgi:hypothetical protein
LKFDEKYGHANEKIVKIVNIYIAGEKHPQHDH